MLIVQCTMRLQTQMVWQAGTAQLILRMRFQPAVLVACGPLILPLLQHFCLPTG